MRADTKKLALTALFAVIALIIFIVEARISLPVRIPGLKLGLANTVSLFMLFLGGKWKARDVFMVLLVRILLAALIVGQPVSLVYSFSGGMLSLSLMLALTMKLKNIPIPVVSVAGAVAHNTGQVMAAALLWRSSGFFALLPALIAGGIISGLFTGFAVYLIFKLHPKFIGYIRR
jgi:heptaprenyl diphosphate synthase